MMTYTKTSLLIYHVEEHSTKNNILSPLGTNSKTKTKSLQGPSCSIYFKHMYHFRILKAVSSGLFHHELASSGDVTIVPARPGPVGHRWCPSPSQPCAITCSLSSRAAWLKQGTWRQKTWGSGESPKCTKAGQKCPYCKFKTIDYP